MTYLKKIQNNLHKNLIVYYLLLAGFLLRLIFASFPSFHVDADTNFAWALRVVDVGFGGFYSKDVWTNYTPGMIYVFYLLGVFKNLFSISDEFFYFILKLPSIISDVALGYFIYRVLVKKVFQTLALYGLSFYLFNPVMIFNSAIWGAFDAPLTLFVFLAVYYLVERKLVLSSLFLGIAFLIKPQVVAIAPVFGIWILKYFSINRLLKLTVPGLLLIIIFSIPFFPKDPLLGFFRLLIQMSEDYKGNSMFAYNLWGVFGFWIEDSTPIGFLSYQTWGVFLTFIFWLYWLIIFIKRKSVDFFILGTLAFLAFFFLPTRVHERYLFSAFPFLILISVYLRSRILIILTIVLSLIHLANLYYVYIYYNEFYLKLPKILYIPGFYEGLESNAKALSLISTLIFGVIIITISRIVNLQKHGND